MRNIENQQLSAKGSGDALSQSISTADIHTVADLFAAVKSREKSFSPKAVHLALLNNYDNAMKLRVYGSRVFTAVRNFIESVYTKLANALGHADPMVKQLREARDLYRRVMLDAEKAEKRGEKPGEKKYSIGVLQNGNTYVIASRNIITASDVAGMRKQIIQFFNDLLEGNDSVQIPTINGDILTITKAETANKARDSYSTEKGKYIKLSDDMFALKLRAESHIDELAEVSTMFHNSTDKKSHGFAKDGFSYRRVFFEDFDGKYYRITLSVGNNGTTATVYNVGQIKEDKLPSVKLMTVVGSKPLGKMSSDNSIPADEENVKKNNSFGDLDAAYTKAVKDGDVATQQRLVDEAAEKAMPNSKARKGEKLLGLYHGTDADFNTFDFGKHGGKNGTTLGFGIYLTDSRAQAAEYGDRQINGYVDITRPAYSFRKTISREELSRLIVSSALRQARSMTGRNDYGVALYNTWIANRMNTLKYSDPQTAINTVADRIAYNIWSENDNDVGIVKEIMDEMGVRDSAAASRFYDEVLTPSIGIDGIWQVLTAEDASRNVNVFLAFRSSQVKSADPVTYDDDGKVIPLSQRFDRSKGDIRYSIGDIDADYAKSEITMADVLWLRSIAKRGRISINEFDHNDLVKAQKWAYKFYQELGNKSPFFRAWFGDWRAHDTKTKRAFIPVNTSKITPQDVSRTGADNIDTGWHIDVTRDGIDETSAKRGIWSPDYHSLASINDMLANAILLDTVVVDEKPSKRMGKAAAFVHHLYCPVSVDGVKAIAKLYVTEEIENKNKFYLTKIEAVSTDSTGLRKSIVPHSSADTAEYSVAQIFDFVKRNNDRFEADSEHPTKFSPKAVHPALLNKDGTPRVVYHGTDAQFTVFDASKIGSATGTGAYGDGFYFTDSKKSARDYATGDGRIVSAYLRMEKPYFAKSSEAGYLSKNRLIQEGYDGVIVRGGKENLYVIFDSTQVKSATDNIGTFDRTNPDINFSLSPAEQVEELVEEYGAIEPGENPAVEVKVPRRSSKELRVRRGVRTVLESGTLTDEMAEKPGFGKNPEARFYLVISR